MSKSWEQILGGYATDTLTEEEKRQLFEAALQDQTLFDALADEEGLKALLAHPEARQRILASLQASGNSQEATTASSRRLSWFRKPSSLAWAGSLAAMGLALIFGWQMNKDWGPIVQQEQEAERSLLEDKDEEAFRSQPPETAELQEQIQNLQKHDQREPERVAGLSASIPSPQEFHMAKASKDSERIRQSSAQVHSEDLPRKEVKKARRLNAKESVSQLSESAIVQNLPKAKQKVAPAVASPEAIEKGPQQLGRPPAFADKLEEGNAPSFPSAKELFYANKSTRVDEVEEERDGRRAQQLLGGMSSQAEKALTAEVSDLKEAQEVGQVYSQGQMRGIRYRFVQRAADGKDEAIDITQFSGKWSELQLVIESNVSGHLYVLTAYGTGKWQWVRPESSNVPRSSDGAIQVNPYQPVPFALSQVTNTLGKPVLSSITALLSSSPLTDLGKWLGRAGGSEQSEDILMEHTATGIIVIDRSLADGTPLRAIISLEK
jgi:hypothetical protein